MNTKSTAERADPVEIPSTRVSSVLRWKPRVMGVVPVVRWALLVRHEPRLTEENAARVNDAIASAWPELSEAYRAVVAERAGVPQTSVDIDSTEDVRLRYDGKTPMIDFPKVRSIPGSKDPFDLRNCVALCLDDLSSKIWTRVGPPHQSDGGYPVGRLTAVLQRYRSLAKSCGEWFHDELFRLSHDVLQDRKRDRAGALEVTTVGLKVSGHQSADGFDSWLFDSNGGPNLDNEDLCRFMAQATTIDYDIRDVGSREPNAFWMSMPMAVQLENGDLVSRTALYLVRPVGDVVQVVGIGLDDSRSDAFASEVALKVSRVIANRI